MRVLPIDFVDMPEEDRLQKAQFICPFCDKCMPKLDMTGKKANALAVLCKKKHLRVDCAERNGQMMDMKAYNKMFLQKYPQFNRKREQYVTQKVINSMQPRMEYAKEVGHDPLLCLLDLKAVGWRGICTVVCKKCRLDIGSNSRERVHYKCDGKRHESAKVAPGVKFWRAARAENKIEYFKEELGMDDEDLLQTLLAVEESIEKKQRVNIQIKTSRTLRKRATMPSTFQPQL